MTLGRRRLGSHFITETQGPGLRYPDAPGIRARAPSSADTSLAGEIDSLAAHWDAHQSPRLPDYHFNQAAPSQPNAALTLMEIREAPAPD
jgi:hypothetical protein